jgi:hypothetical protein
MSFSTWFVFLFSSVMSLLVNGISENTNTKYKIDVGDQIQIPNTNSYQTKYLEQTIIWYLVFEIIWLYLYK